MKEQGWREFLFAEDIEDWVVLHGGATAVFMTRSLSDAAELGRDIAQLPELADSGVLFTIKASSVTVRLSRDVWQLTARHAELARAISAIARSRGAMADRAAVQEVQVAIAAKTDAIDLKFWSAVLGYVPIADDNAADPRGHGSTVWMQTLDEAKSLRHAMHIDVSIAREFAETRLLQALAAGGRIVDESHAPSWWTLADRAGNRVCICAWPDGIAEKRIAGSD
jgi:4a-hydroxytetrahydrobiopterin dehydratase